MQGEYGKVARAVHWLVAALVVIVVSLGWAIEGAPRETLSRDLLLLLHRSIGMTILAAMVFRAFWRWHRPPPPWSVAPIEAALARLTYFALYLLLIAMPLSGYVNAAAADHAVSLYGIVAIPPLLPVSGRLSQIAVTLHLTGQYLIYLFVALHVAGALMHAVIRRDGVLERMLPARRAG